MGPKRKKNEENPRQNIRQGGPMVLEYYVYVQEGYLAKSREGHCDQVEEQGADGQPPVLRQLDGQHAIPHFVRHGGLEGRVGIKCTSYLLY